MDIQKRAMIEALESTLGIVTKACQIANVCRQTHYNWLKDDPEYKEAVDRVDDMTLDFAESELHKQIGEGNATSTIFFLKTKGKKRGYIEGQQIEHSGSMCNITMTFEQAYLLKYGTPPSEGVDISEADGL